MKRIALALALLMTVTVPVLFSGCEIVTGSGETQTLEMDYANFSRLEIDTGFEAEITRADTFAVTLTIDKSLYEYLSIAQRGDTLHIGLKANRTYTAASRKAVIKLPDLRRLELSGGARGNAAGFSVTHDMDFSLSGGSRLTLQPTDSGKASFTLTGGSSMEGDIRMSSGSIDLSGGSKIQLAGSANDIKVNASAGSTATLDEMPVNTATVELQSGSGATVKVSDILNVNLSAGSELNYAGSPKIGEIKISGGSKFNQTAP